MKYRASTHALAAIFLSLTAIAAAIWLVFPRNAEGKKRESWMLRPDAIIEGFRISVGKGESDGYPEIEIVRLNGAWFARSKGKPEVPADSARVESFLAAIKKKRPIWKSTLAKAQSIMMQNALTLRLYGRDQTIASEIAFIGFDASAARLRFTSARDIVVLETEDDLSSYLSAESGSWIDHAPFRALESTSDIQRVIVESGGKRTGLSGDAAHGLIDTLQSLTCRDASPVNTDGNPVIELTLEFGDLSVKKLRVYPAGAELVISDEKAGWAWNVGAWSAQRLVMALSPQNNTDK